MKTPKNFNYFYENYFENIKVLVLIHVINYFNLKIAAIAATV